MKINVLVIEDDQLMAGLLVEKLSKADFNVRLAGNGEAGLNEMEKEVPDIVLLDLILPGLGGFEVLAKIKENEATKGVSIIILSNLGSREEIERGMKLGAEGYLIKSNVLIDEVVTEIRKVAAKRQMP